VFYSFGGRFLLLSFLKGSSYRQLKIVCYVTVLTHYTAMLYGVFGIVVVRPSVRL